MLKQLWSHVFERPKSNNNQNLKSHSAPEHPVPVPHHHQNLKKITSIRRRQVQQPGTQAKLYFITFSKPGIPSLAALHQWCDRHSIPLCVLPLHSRGEPLEIIVPCRISDNDWVCLFRSPHVLVHASSKEEIINQLSNHILSKREVPILFGTSSVQIGRWKNLIRDKDRKWVRLNSDEIVTHQNAPGNQTIVEAFVTQPTYIQSIASYEGEREWLSMARLAQRVYYWSNFVQGMHAQDSKQIQVSPTPTLFTYLGETRQGQTANLTKNMESWYQEDEFWFWMVVLIAFVFILLTIVFVVLYAVVQSKINATGKEPKGES